MTQRCYADVLGPQCTCTACLVRRDALVIDRERAAARVELERFAPRDVFRIQCDRTGCDNEITVNHPIAPTRLVAIARAAGWKATGQNHQWCPRCKDADSKGAP